MEQDKQVSNVNTLTHRVHFRKPGMEPQLIDAKKAEKVNNARGNPAYNQSTTVEVGEITCELRDIAMIEKLGQVLVRRGFYRCDNEKCSNENRMHPSGEKCEYSFTAKCVECAKDVWERDRVYSLYKWGKVLCRKHSPFGHADELFPGEWSVELSRLRGMAAHYIEKGLNDEQVMEAVNRDMKKWKVGL